ncbi:MAG: hypothetical protein P1U42_00530 [Phycisphaerales bacterium]|nr:hypothetical protein [Phycisphaerales bacterium]
MSTTSFQLDRRFAHSSMITLALGFVLSVMINLSAGIGVSGYYKSSSSASDDSTTSMEVTPDAMMNQSSPEQIKLGSQESSQASIHWLGVVENPEVGDAPIAVVEQAAFTPIVGNAPENSAPASSTPDPSQPAEPQVTQQPIEQPASDPIEIDPIEPQDENPRSPIETAIEQVEIEVVQVEAEIPKITLQPEIIDNPSQAEQVKENTEVEIEPDLPIGPSLVSADPTPEPELVQEPVENTESVTVSNEDTQAEPTNDQAESQPAPQVQPTEQESNPSVAGKDGILSKRESTASIIKRAIKVDAKSLNRPIVGEGLEITTVEPKFPASVRFTQLPRNPVLIIRFDANGRVSKVRFLSEGRRVFDTGSKSVDEPLVNAVYKWRAKGTEIDSLDPKGPESFVEISMNIIFSQKKNRP